MDRQRSTRVCQALSKVVSSMNIDKAVDLLGIDVVGYGSAYADRSTTEKCAKKAVELGKTSEFMSILTRGECEAIFHRTMIPAGRSAKSISEEEDLVLSISGDFFLVVGEDGLFDFMQALSIHLRSETKEMDAAGLAAYIESFWPHVRFPDDASRRLSSKILKSAVRNLREKKNDPIIREIVMMDDRVRLVHPRERKSAAAESAQSIEAD
jgi:hypothetical protein